jgi:hypothetical protein
MIRHASLEWGRARKLRQEAPNMAKDQPTSFRFSTQTQDIIKRLAEELGLSRVAVIELAVRQLARRELPDYQPSKKKPRKND